MKLIKKIQTYLIDIGLKKHISDEMYLRKIYKNKLGKKLNLDPPVTFNEKLQWLKINDRKDIYTTMVDKYEVKKYVASIIGEEYIIPTLGIYEKFNEIIWDNLPNRFVMKCTHDSGSVLVCTNKTKVNIFKERIKFNLLMKRNFYYRYREWPYKNVKPRVIIEEFLDTGKKEISDYKFWCFNGEPKMCLVCTDRKTELKETFFDMDWNLLNLKRPNHNIDDTIRKPRNFELMKELARKLSQNIPFIRVDFYEISEKVFFGELTFYPASGLKRFEPEKWDKILGEMIVLPAKR